MRSLRVTAPASSPPRLTSTPPLTFSMFQRLIATASKDSEGEVWHRASGTPIPISASARITALRLHIFRPMLPQRATQSNASLWVSRRLEFSYLREYGNQPKSLKGRQEWAYRKLALGPIFLPVGCQYALYGRRTDAGFRSDLPGAEAAFLQVQHALSPDFR